MKYKFLTLAFLTILVVGSFGIIPSLPLVANTQNAAQDLLESSPLDVVPQNLMPAVEQALAEDNPYLPADYDLGLVLGDRDNDFKVMYEPWRSKAAIHAIAYDEPTGFLALGGGYLYDNEVHLFRLNVETNNFDKVWDTGDSLFQSDVMSIAFGDTDLNDFIEIVAGCADGHVYVFEQRHLYDPYANTENQFDHVWTSPDMFRAFSVIVEDIDRDYRPDIIAGGWDGKVHIYEYDNHSGYPFVEEHWITYDEVATLDVGDKVYSLAAGDINANGLPDLVVGTRDGTVRVFQNDGITLWVNGYPFPLIYDNHYSLNWTSENYTWSPIMSMEIGELDGDAGDEIALVAQGQGVFTLDWDSAEGTFSYNKVYKDYKEWETFGFWGLDYTVDSVVEAWNVTYHDPINASINVPEPIDYVWGGSYFLPNASVYPYNTGMAGIPDGNFSTFDASDPSVDNATAIVDFGLDEEGTGSANSDPDVLVKFPGLFIIGADLSPYFNFSVSQDGKDFEQVSSDHFIYSGYYLKVDVDDALSRRQWDWFRYVKISVFNGANIRINSLELAQVYNLITDALAVTIGPLKEDGNLWYSGGTEPDKIVVGTVIGELLGIKYDDGDEDYKLFWESGDDDYYTYGANIWDIVYVGTPTNLPNWNYQGGGFISPTGGKVANSWGYGIPDPFGSGTFNTFLAENLPDGGNAYIRAYYNPSYYNPSDIITNHLPDTDLQLLLSDINNDIASVNYGFEYASVENPWILNNYGDDVSVMVIGGLDEDIPLESAYSVIADEYAYYRGNIIFYFRDSATDPWNAHKQLFQVDTDGQLTGLVNLATATPRTDFADYDGDGDVDFVVSNGRLYMAENVQEVTGMMNFTLKPGYFDTINEIESAKIWGQPDLQDLDGDGDLDLVLSYDNRNGATTFINEGTLDDPVWVENKKLMSNTGELTNLNLLNITNIRMIPHAGSYLGGSYLERYYEYYGLDTFDFYMQGYNGEIDAIIMCAPEAGAADAYIVATYPTVSRLQINLMEGDIRKFYNLGFHVMEDWNNEDDLDDWALSITSADTDSDGNNEIIIGDYDNNVYAFEHLVNNTYKRMFRSFDLNHSETTDTSPYAYEDLEGISGDFNRRIWDHAEHLLADVDLDNDGLKEIIVAANLQVYIFEEVGLFGGDAVHFVYTFDLRDTEFGDRPNFEDYADKIGAMAAGDDIDYDGRPELAVAAGPYLFIFNVNPDSFEEMENNDYFVTSPVMEGRYYLPGNGDNSIWKYHQINAMTMCDTDKDGYREIIIGGIQDVRLVRQNGFVYLYECVGGTFQQTWTAPTEVTTWNPISVLLLDDQDYDGETEIIIGHSQGFDMWEHIPGVDDGYQKVEYVTASPNYPIMPVKTTFPGAETYPISGRSIKDIAFIDAGPLAGSAWMAYEAYGVNPEIHIKGYVDDTDYWSAGANLGSALVYNGNSSNIVEEYNPSIAAMTDGSFSIAWEAYDAGGIHYLAMTYFDSSSGWQGIQLSPETTGLYWVDRFNPGVFEFNSTHVGMVYTYKANLAISDIGCYIIKKDLTGGFSGKPMNFNNFNRMRTHDIDAVRLADDRIAVALSAKNIDTYKPDHDVWVAVSNENFNFTGVNPHQATTSYSEEMFVDIDYLRTGDQSLVVIYESLNEILEDKLKMVSSQNDGATWSIPEEVNPLPQTVTRTEQPGGIVTYSVYQPSAYSPAFCARPDGGFIYVFTFASVFNWYSGSDRGWLRLVFNDIVYGRNMQSDWASNHLREVGDLDVGDTDGDGRREVAVAFDHQVAVYEMDSSTNGTGFMFYSEEWLSAEFEYPVTGITISDSNSNGWDDLAISCERGEVFFMEYIDVSEGTVPLRGSTANFSATPSGSGWFGGANGIVSYDIDGDDKEELIVAPYTNNTVQAFDEDGSIIWTNTDAGAGFKRVYLFDLTNDTIPEVLLAGFDNVLRVLNVTDGTELWNYNTASGDVLSIDVADLEGDGEVEIAIGTSADDVFIIHNNGSQYYNWSLAMGDVYQLKFGNLTGSDHLDLVMVTGTKLSVMNPTNGTVIYQTPSNYVATGPNLQLADFNDDDVDDIVFARFGFQILDMTTQTIIYNSTLFDSTYFVLDLWVFDFDGDGALEIVGFNGRGEVFMEDVAGGITQWQYSAQSPYGLYDAEVGSFGGSGELDIVLGLVDGSSAVTLAIDGKNGIPIWFNRTGGLPFQVSSADIHGTGMDTALLWDIATFEIIGVDSYERVPIVEDDTYHAHEIYWEYELADLYVGGTHVADLNNDGIDELVMWDNNVTLMLLNGSNGALMWSVEMDGSINKVEVGNMDGSGWLDIVVQTKYANIFVLEGQSGQTIGTIARPGTFEPRDFYVRNFSGTLDNNEVAVLWQDATHVFLEWYNHDGAAHYRSSSNVTAQVQYMAVGDITGDGLPDVAIGGYNKATRIYRGTDGQFMNILGTGGSSVYGLLIGNFTGDAYADYVWEDNSHKLHLIDGASNTQILFLDFINLIDEYYAVDIDNDGLEELVVNIEKLGVQAFSYTGALDWSFQARLLVSQHDWDLTFGDMDNDGTTDVIMTNHEYIDVISGATERLLWHFVSDDRNVKPKVGHFVGTSAPLDIVSYRWGRVYVVSGTDPVPTPPASPLPMLEASFNLGEIVDIAAGVGTPVALLLLMPIGLVWYRKRKETE
ncbi:MAG: FG-GAP-like repeat-containing protein [Candidatus Thorarchaeota archaeon]|nr:FG-GAP-like repeat-containing protein [Candidatus Thorarchaeota archaeon]